MHLTSEEFQRGQTAVETQSNIGPITRLPNWLPDAFRLYIDHTEQGQSIRALARREGLNASTVLRHVRKCELRRDDPLVDSALAAFHHSPTNREDAMHHSPIATPTMDDVAFAQSALRLLRRLAETGAFLAIAPNMEKAAVMRALPGGRLMRIAVIEKSLAQVFAVKEWIAVKDQGKVTTYELTAAGKSELKARLASAARGMAEAGARFSGEEGAADWGAQSGRRSRYNLAESPVAVLGRRRDKDGAPYLLPEFVRAAERLREDFELAQMGASVSQNWDHFLTGGVTGGRHGAGAGPTTPRDARARVAAALADLGPDLGHIALRVCCYLEGVEEAEQKMGWAARSGKVVLRIALRRLARHYDEVYGPSGPMIG